MSEILFYIGSNQDNLTPNLPCVNAFAIINTCLVIKAK